VIHSEFLDAEVWTEVERAVVRERADRLEHMARGMAPDAYREAVGYVRGLDFVLNQARELRGKE
jgi:hypothetical protein